MRRVAAVVGIICAILVVLAVVVLPSSLGSIFGTQDGERIAGDRAAAMAEAMESDFGYQRDIRDAETIAAGLVFSSRSEVTPVAWSGSTREGDEAIIDARIRVEVEARGGGFGNGPTVSAGTAERCYRFTLVIHDDARRVEIDCAGLPTAVDPPVAALVAALPEDAATRLETVLAASAPSELAMNVRAEFGDPEFSVDTTLTDDGELVVALGAMPSRDCIVRVRTVDGTIVPVSFDRIWLEPGEGGCTVALYTAPPL